MSVQRDFETVLRESVALGREALAMQQPGPAGIPLRPLGRTGEMVTVVGLGGWDSVAFKSDEESVTFMHEALDHGITFWDNAWEYHDGRAEEVMGRAIEEGRIRDRVFLMTKICARDYDGFHRQLGDSLRRLRTDHVDLMQLHSIQYPGDRERFLDPENGALKGALEAQAAGKIRHIGFTGHMDATDHLGMLAAPYEWATVQMPVNIVDAHKADFQHRVLPECRRREIGLIGMKSLGGNQGRIPKSLGIEGRLCRQYAMSLPVSTLVCGMQTREELHEVIGLARGFEPLTEAEMESVLSITKDIRDENHLEEFKDRSGPFGCLHHAAVLNAGQ